MSQGVLHRGKAVLPWEAMWEPSKHTRPVQARNVTREFSLPVGAIIKLNKTDRLCQSVKKTRIRREPEGGTWERFKWPQPVRTHGRVQGIAWERVLKLL